jgi:hypothetical protein
MGGLPLPAWSALLSPILTNFLRLSYELLTTFIRTFYAELSELEKVELWRPSYARTCYP